MKIHFLKHSIQDVKILYSFFLLLKLDVNKILKIIYKWKMEKSTNKHVVKMD